MNAINIIHNINAIFILKWTLKLKHKSCTEIKTNKSFILIQ